VLVQEFLEGREYVVDCVSLEGKHKVWVCMMQLLVAFRLHSFSLLPSNSV
jgi:hypothetical protein